MAVFIPAGVPGDRLLVSGRAQGRLARARILQVLRPSPHRVVSDCDLHPACGGCPWIEVDDGESLRAKERILRDALERVGKLDLSAVEVRGGVRAPSRVRYRHRARLHAERQDGRFVLGFLPGKGRGVVHVRACGVLEPPLDRCLALVHGALSGAGEVPRAVTLSCEPEEAGGKVGVHVEVGGRPEAQAWRPVVQRLVARGVGAVEVEGRHGTVVATEDLVLRGAVAPGVDGGPFGHDASSFTQGNRAQNVALVRLVVEGLRLEGTERVLELYSGCGNFTLALASRCGRVVAMESSPRSTRHARANAERAGLGDRVVALSADADGVAATQAAVDNRVDMVLLDPPRTGAPGLARVCAQARPSRVVYVSCNPATLARDLAHVVAQGYALRSVQAVDLFPRTWHVEAVAVLERGGRRGR
jgi:23S rRNA (uracil1939-C5)-methyltransferase